MLKIKNLFKKYWHIFLLLYFFIYLPWFFWLNEYTPTRPEAVEMYCKLDDLIPFNELFAIPYFIWFGYIAFGFLFFFFYSKKEFIQMCTFLYTGMTLCLIIYTIFPNCQMLRVDYSTLGRENILIDWLAMLQAGDTPYNVFPSIHCLNSIGMNIAMARNKWFKEHPWTLVLVTLLTISICLSTAFVKQHSILDFFGSIVLSFILYPIAYMIPWRQLFKRKRNI